MAEEEGVSGSQMTMDMIPASGQPDSISLDHGNLTISYNDPASIAAGEEAMVISYSDPGFTQGEDGEVVDGTEFTEALAGQQLLQMANAIAAASERDTQNLEGIPSTDQHNVEMLNIAKTMTELQPDGTAQVIPVSVTDMQGQIVELVPMTGGDGKQVYVQLTKPVESAETTQELTQDEGMEVSGIGQIEIASAVENGEVVIDGLPQSYQNYENLKTEVLEDGSIQLYFVDPKKDAGNYIVEKPSEDPGQIQGSMMSVTAKKFRDVATQITVFPKFTRSGLFDVSTQVLPRDLSMSPRKRALANGTTVIQNSIKTQNESTVILNSGEGEIIFFKCNICNKVYKNKMNWQNHIKLHAQEKVYMCGHCGKIYQKGSLSTHLRTHSELRQIAVFENLPKNLKRKNHKAVPGSVMLSEEASIIELSIGDVATELDPVLFPPEELQALENPPQTHTVTQEAETEPDPSADVDVAENNTESNVESNVENPPSPHPAPPDDAVVEETEVYTTEAAAEVTPAIEIEAEAEVQDGTKTRFIYKCNICGKEYNNKSNCHRHLKSHTESKNYKCGYCGKAFTHRYEVKMHCRTHTGERPFKCPICTRGFNESGNLRRHMKIHQNDDSPYKCGVCFKGFNDMHRLNAHTKVHTGDIVCDTCGRKFSKISDLYRHIKIHTGERPYKCEVCGKTFCQKVNLTTHMRTHTGQKAFKCNICGVGFSRKVTMEAHMKNHKDDGDFPVVRSSAIPEMKRSQVKVMEADVIEHMEALTQEYTVTDHTFSSPPKRAKKRIKKPTVLAQKIVLADGQEIILEDGADDDEEDL